MDKETGLQEEIKEKWRMVLEYVEREFGKKPDLNAILFLIGVRELGELPKKKFTKDDKTGLMHIATCKLLSYSGYYELNGLNEQGWPDWINVKPVPSLSLFEQETLLRQHIVEYFESEEIIAFT